MDEIRKKVLADRDSNIDGARDKVFLLWGQDELHIDHTYVKVIGDSGRLEFEVPPEEALGQFYHVRARIGELAVQSA